MFFHPLPGHWVCHAVGVCHVRTHSQGPCCQPGRTEGTASKEALYFHIKQNWSTLLLVPALGAGRAVGRPGPLEACVRPVPRPRCPWEEGPGRGRRARRKCQGILDGGRQGGWPLGDSPAGHTGKAIRLPGSAEASLLAGGATEPQGSFRKYPPVKGHLGSWGHKRELPATGTPPTQATPALWMGHRLKRS